MGTRRGSDEVIISALAAGNTQADAGALADVSERTVRRRLQNPAFAQRVEDRRRDIEDESVARLGGLANKALSTLDDALFDRQASVRLRAADLILRHSVVLRERTQPSREEGRAANPS